MRQKGPKPRGGDWGDGGSVLHIRFHYHRGNHRYASQSTYTSAHAPVTERVEKHCHNCSQLIRQEEGGIMMMILSVTELVFTVPFTVPTYTNSNNDSKLTR